MLDPSVNNPDGIIRVIFSDFRKPLQSYKMHYTTAHSLSSTLHDELTELDV